MLFRSPSGPVELRVAYYNAGGQTEIDYRQAQADKFTELHPNVTVKMEPVSDWGEQVYPQLAAGTAADVLWIDTDTGYGRMVGLGAWQSLAPFIEKEGYDLSPWPKTMLDHFSGPDGLLILPNSNLSFNFLYYNKKLFDAAGGKAGMTIEYWYNSNGTTDNVQLQLMAKQWEQNLGVKTTLKTEDYSIFLPKMYLGDRKSTRLNSSHT